MMCTEMFSVKAVSRCLNRKLQDKWSFSVYADISLVQDNFISVIPHDSTAVVVNTGESLWEDEHPGSSTLHFFKVGLERKAC